MHILRHFTTIPPAYRHAVIALGNFDGVHLGHQAILRHTISLAKASGVPAAVMTFEPHPREFFNRSGDKLRLYPLRRKIELLRDTGLDLLFIARFNRQFAAQTAQGFVETLLHKQLGASHVVTGYNFGFGKGREGNTASLDHMAATLGMGYTACPPVQDADGQIISSSAIRAALAEGNPDKASALLGRPYCIAGRVQRGQQRGKTLGFPTANLSLAHLFKPRLGIYAVRVRIGRERMWRGGVASLGINPTFGLAQPLLEAHIFDMDSNLYGQYLRVELVAYLREEKKFASIEDLRAQMTEDCQKAKEWLHAHRP